MSYLMVKNWEEFQAYKDGRTMVWIKVWTKVLQNYEFCQLTDAERYHLVGIWCLASETKGRLPDDSKWLSHQLSATTKINLNKLIKLGFLIKFNEDGSVYEDPDGLCTKTSTQTSTQMVAIRREEKRREEKKREEEKLKFLDCVKLTADQLKTLVDKHGKLKTDSILKELNDYKMSSGKTYKSDYHAIGSWVEEKVNKKFGNSTQVSQNNDWTCKVCHKQASSISDGMCPECKDKNDPVRELTQGLFDMPT